MGKHSDRPALGPGRSHIGYRLTGEEPYTLGIILFEMLNDLEKWKVNIFGSDIDRTALEKAKKGRYEARSLRDVPAAYLQRHFQKNPDTQHLPRNPANGKV